MQRAFQYFACSFSILCAALNFFDQSRAGVLQHSHTIGEALNDLTGRYPSLRKHLLDENGALRSFVNLFVNGENIRQLNGVNTRITPGDKLAIIPAIAGG